MHEGWYTLVACAATGQDEATVSETFMPWITLPIVGRAPYAPSRPRPPLVTVRHTATADVAARCAGSCVVCMSECGASHRLNSVNKCGMSMKMFENCHFCLSLLRPGAVEASTANVLLFNNTMLNNTAFEDGGAVYVNSTGSSVRIESCAFGSNRVSGSG